ncbi:MAG: ABC transporter substrate-binding protein [Methanosarcinaceae archaeon]|nr:ABC transporter substrate-binding protein [Methanosarcinaceae archaeon]
MSEKNVKKAYAALFVIIILVVAVAAVFILKNTPEQDIERYTNNSEIQTKVVTDVTGRKVTLSENVKTMIVTPIPYTSMVYAIDGTAEKLIAIHPSAKEAYGKSLLKNLAPELENIPDKYVSREFAINAEEIFKLNPDVVILWSHQENDLRKLEELDIPVITLTAGANSNIDDMRKNMRIVGELLGKEEKANQLIEYNLEVEKYFIEKNKNLSDIKKPKVLYIRDRGLKVAGGDSFNGRLIELTGGTNVAKDVKGSWSQVSMEQIMGWDPDIIYLSHFDDIYPEDLYDDQINRQYWSNISAVKNKQVYKTPIGIYRWDAPNAETPLFMKWIAQIQQPEIYNDYDLEYYIKQFYKDYFNYELKENDMDIMFNRI